MIRVSKITGAVQLHGADGQDAPWQPATEPAGAAVCEQDEDTDEVQTVDGQREGVGIDSDLSGAFGE